MGRTSALQNRVFSVENDTALTKTYIGMVFAFQGLLVCGSVRDAVRVVKLCYQKRQIQPAAGDGRSSTKVAAPEKENPAGRRRRPFQYKDVVPEKENPAGRRATAIPILKSYCQRRKIQLAAGDGRSSTIIVLPDNEERIAFTSMWLALRAQLPRRMFSKVLYNSLVAAVVTALRGASRAEILGGLYGRLYAPLMVVFASERLGCGAWQGQLQLGEGYWAHGCF